MVTNDTANLDPQDPDEFDHDDFWEKITRLAGRLGKGLVERLLIAYQVAIDPKTPLWARGTLFGALAYFGLPLDAVPDVVPFMGFTDDLTLLTAALGSVILHTRWRHVRRARRTMDTLGLAVEAVSADKDDDEVANIFRSSSTQPTDSPPDDEGDEKDLRREGGDAAADEKGPHP